MKTTADIHATRELLLYADNTFTVYDRHTVPTIRNLHKKAERGVYDYSKACKAWEYVAEAAAKAYAREFATAAEWCRIFNAATRRAVAAELELMYRDQVLGGVSA